LLHNPAPMAGRFRVHKFGGTSVATLERYRRVAEIVRGEKGRTAIVVSAMAGVTDALIGLTDLARTRDPSYAQRLAELEARHLAVIEALGAPLIDVIRRDVRDLADVLRAVWLGRSCPEGTVELVSGYGEVWSAQILRAVMGEGTSWIDARDVLTIERTAAGVDVDWSASRADLARALERSERTVVITGYVARTRDGVPATLGRNGSDYSASIFGALLDAEAITIWTDVDGVLSADPRRVPDAVVLDELSYDEAMELAYFGAKVVHPRTMAPAVAHDIPIWIKNTFAPEKPGTRIGPPARKGGSIEATHAVKGFSTVDGVALLNLEGTGMVGVPGVAQRLFGALRDVGVSVIMISQASSEHSICFAVPEAAASLARATVERAFAHEIQGGQIQRLGEAAACSILAAVGEGMVDTPGVAAAFFGALARAGINVRAIAQGSSERNISAVIDRSASTRALRAAHAGFYLSSQTISVGVIGAGIVGSALLDQLRDQIALLRSALRIDLRVRAVMNTRSMRLGDPSIDLSAWRAAAERAPDFATFEEHVRADHLPHAVIIDASASDAVADRYLGWLDRGIHVITPNKRAGAGPLDRYREIRRRARDAGRHFFYEATVGAGLPVISTLRDLILTGDRVIEIQGILSGTLSYLFGERGRFADVVSKAKGLGYTEPDPRDDLSGRDVARKLVILAREMGRLVELDEVRVESLVPPELEHVATPEEFLERLPDRSGPIDDLRERAATSGEVLRYVGTVGAEGAPSVELRRFSASHPFAAVAGGANIIAFRTARYADHPLIVQGPGAGPAVTAGGVFADLLRLAAHLGAPS
jgi:aspartokinase/homoserine dehydrogenase 1